MGAGGWQEQEQGTPITVPPPASVPTCKVQKDPFKKKKKKSSIRSWLKNNKSVVKCG